MGTGSITIVLDGITATRGGADGMQLQISGTEFVLDSSADTGVNNINGFTGLSIGPNVIRFTTVAGSAITGTLTLTATAGGGDPTLTLNGFTSSGAFPWVTWSVDGGGETSMDLSTGSLPLSNFGSSD